MLWPCQIISRSTFLCNSTKQPSLEMENSSYYDLTFQPNVDRQGTIPVYPVLSKTERQSVEQPEYANINKPKKQMVSRKGPPCQTVKLNAIPNQESQKLYPSEEIEHIYDEPVLSIKEIPSQTIIKRMDSSRNGKPRKLFPSEEITPVYIQPDLPKKEKKK